jgi:hypothetical protein
MKEGGMRQVAERRREQLRESRELLCEDGRRRERREEEVTERERERERETAIWSF